MPRTKKCHYKSYTFFGHSFILIKFTYLMWINTQKIFNFSTTLPTLLFFFFNHSHFERWEMISLMALIYISLMTNNVEHIFLYLLTISISSLEKCPFKPLTNFSIGLLWFFSCCCFALELWDFLIYFTNCLFLPVLVVSYPWNHEIMCMYLVRN